MLEEMEIEGRDFEADSWRMAVDSAYLQKHRKDVIKRQDVIYGENALVLPVFGTVLQFRVTLGRACATWFLNISSPRRACVKV